MLQQELAPCACAPRYAGGCGGGRCVSPAPAFSSLLFPVPTPMGLPSAEQCCYYHAEDGGPVDCTLSLSTPSTRRAEAAGVVHARTGGGGSTVSMEEPHQGSPSRRRCASCDTTSTPLWRNGPRGPKSLCNACGIRYKKEERRAAAAVAPATQDSGAPPYACGGYAGPPPPLQQQQQWGCYASPAAGMSAASYGMYGGDVGVVDAAAAAAAAAAVDRSCLSWMLNVMPSSPAFAVPERHTLFQYY